MGPLTRGKPHPPTANRVPRETRVARGTEGHRIIDGGSLTDSVLLPTMMFNSPLLPIDLFKAHRLSFSMQVKNLTRALLVTTASLCAVACSAPDKKASLAKRHCSSCHLFPDPSLLKKETWETGVFPEMSLRMGLDLSELMQKNPDEVNEIIQAIPPSPAVTQEEWEAIREYYITNAPESLRQHEAQATLPLNQFAVSSVSLPLTGRNMLTMVRHDPFSKKIFIGTRKGKLYRLLPSFALEDSLDLGSAPSEIIFSDTEEPIISCMGIMDPNDQPAGSVIQLNSFRDKPAELIDSVKRPVYLEKADMNNDGEQDLLVSAFGNFTGGLYVYEKRQGDYVRHPVHPFPGTRKTIVRDMNGDGLPDILALISQGDEQIALFTNRGNFRFSYRVLLKFLPVYGSSYFDIRDFNGDTHPDILYTNGDNADYSPILKPYHGVRIFLNDGKNQFTESLFYPMHGASMAKAVDFDEDGDLDIAAISFFPDFENHPEQTFIYLENNAGKFTAYTTPLAAYSRWMILESSDIDNDSDMDIILSALAFPTAVPDSLVRSWKEKNISLLVLKNNLR